jgi:hypothetical protein
MSRIQTVSVEPGPAQFAEERERVFGPAKLYKLLSRAGAPHFSGAARLGGRAARRGDACYQPDAKRAMHKTIPVTELPATAAWWPRLGRTITAIVTN